MGGPTSIPTPETSDEVFLVGSRSLTTGVLTLGNCDAASAYKSAGVTDVTIARRLALRIAVNGATSESNAQVALFVASAGCSQINGAAPTGIMDVWYAPLVVDGSVTASALTGTMPASQVMTAAPNWGIGSPYGLWIKLPVLTAAANRWRGTITFDVSCDRYFQVFYAEIGDTTNRSTVALSYNLAT